LSVTRKKENILSVFLTFLKNEKNQNKKRNLSSTAPCDVQINKCAVHGNNDAYCYIEDRNTCRISAGNADVTDNWEDLDADRIIQEESLKKWEGNA
jgi:hypothetical protein